MSVTHNKKRPNKCGPWLGQDLLQEQELLRINKISSLNAIEIQPAQNKPSSRFIVPPYNIMDIKQWVVRWDSSHMEGTLQQRDWHPQHQVLIQTVLFVADLYPNNVPGPEVPLLDVSYTAYRGMVVDKLYCESVVRIDAECKPLVFVTEQDVYKIDQFFKPTIGLISLWYNHTTSALGIVFCWSEPYLRGSDIQHSAKGLSSFQLFPHGDAFTLALILLNEGRTFMNLCHTCCLLIWRISEWSISMVRYL